MSHTIQCTECGTSDCQLIESNRYKCNSCGAIFDDLNAQNEMLPDQSPHTDDTTQIKNPLISILLGLLLVGGIFGYGIISMNKTVRNKIRDVKENIVENMEDDDVTPKYTEITQSFLVVPGKEKTEIWLIKRRNSSDLKEVDYRLSIESPVTRKELYSKPIINSISWDESFNKNFQIGHIKKAGSRCWIIIGKKDLVGYDIVTRQKTTENSTLISQFHQFSDGISYVDDLYNIAGFKVTSKEGFNYYYLPEDNKVLTEVEYDNVRRNENSNNTNWAFHTEYIFSDGERQQLYKLVRRHHNLRIRKIYPNEVQNILNDESLWYRKMYNVVSMEEFTPGKFYFNGNVLYDDDEYCVYISTSETNAESAIIVQCLDKNRKLLWTVPGGDVQEFKSFLMAENPEAFRKNNELVFQIPYQIAISVNILTGKIIWKYKLVEPVS